MICPNKEPSTNAHIRHGVMMVTIGTLLVGSILAPLTIILPLTAQAQSGGSPPGAPSSRLASLTYRWWQWLFSIDTSTQPNPFTTTYQGDCSQLMQGNTIFLVGQGPAGSVSNHGTCIISSQTSILFPVINGVDIDCTSQQQRAKPPGLCTFNMHIPARGQPFQELRNNPFVAGVSGATNLVASIDGVPLQSVQVQSPPGGFGVRLAPHDPFGFNVGPVTLHGVANGFWVLLPPLSPGQHTLTFGGCLPSSLGGGCQTNTYTLIVR
jgi:hypothetical protein